MRKNHYLLSFVGQEDKDKNMVQDVIFVCKLGKEKRKETRINFPKKTWETCLEVCLAARHGRSQLINFTFRSWAYFSLYYLTKNMNDFAWRGEFWYNYPSCVPQGCQQHSPCGEPLFIQNCSLPLRHSLSVRPLSGICQKLSV